MAFGRVADTWQSTLLNLGTELLGVVFTFFFIGYLFSLDELELGERIEKLVSRLENEDKVSANKFFKQTPIDYNTLIRTSTHIDLCGAVLAGTIDKNLSPLKDALKQGAKIRILVMSNDSEILKIASARSETEDDITYYTKKLEMTFQNADYLKKYTITTLKLGDDAFNIRLLKFPPSYSILSFKNSDNSNLFIEMYAHHVGWGESPLFGLEQKAEAEWYNYFQRQFDAMWESALHYENNKNTERGH